MSDDDGEGGSRLDSEWVTVNAVRELIRLATRGDRSKATYKHALELGAEICPEILGDDVSVLKRAKESQITREYRQLAEAQSRKADEEVTALALVKADITKLSELLESSRGKQQTNLLMQRLKLLKIAQSELDPVSHSENQLIFRDAYNVNRNLPTLDIGQGSRDFELPDENVLRIRVLHPDRPEHLTGADMIYERHATSIDEVSVIALQYKNVGGWDLIAW